MPGATREWLHRYGLQPLNLVFEITERNAIRDLPSFQRALAHYREQGYLVAIDDLDTGYSNLHALAELRPDFVKIDMSLVRNLHLSPSKMALVEALVHFARKAGLQLIAEGVESWDEIVALMGLRVPYAQGFFLARPGFPPPEPTPDVRARIRSGGRSHRPWFTLQLQRWLRQAFPLSGC